MDKKHCTACKKDHPINMFYENKGVISASCKSASKLRAWTRPEQMARSRGQLGTKVSTTVLRLIESESIERGMKKCDLIEEALVAGLRVTAGLRA